MQERVEKHKLGEVIQGYVDETGYTDLHVHKSGGDWFVTCELGLPKPLPLTVEEAREKLWSAALKLTVELEYAKGINKTKLRAKYEGMKVAWEILGGDRE